MTLYLFTQLTDTDVFAGTLHHHTRGSTESATFLYDPEYLARPDAYPLDPRLPLTAGPHQTDVGRALFGAMTDSAPDRWGRRLMQRYARVSHRGPGARVLTDVDYLLGVRDDLRQGALRYALSRSGPQLAPDTAEVPRTTNLAHLLDLATRSQRDDLTERELRLLLDSSSSLGGARPKVHALDAEGNLSIAKFPSSDTDTWSISAWEWVTARLAAHAGITVPQVELLNVAGRSVLLSRRFDRHPHGRRVGYWSAMTALEATDGDHGSYVDIAAFIEVNSLAATDDLRQLFTRVAFDLAVTNTDNHLRNHGFLRRGAGWALSPAFDINPNPDGGRFATGLVARDGSDMTVDALLESAQPVFRLDEDSAVETLANVTSAVGRWRHEAGRAHLPAVEVDMMSDAFENPRLRDLTAYLNVRRSTPPARPVGPSGRVRRRPRS